jgi:hypothetical protein
MNGKRKKPKASTGERKQREPAKEATFSKSKGIKTTKEKKRKQN